jgi:DNA-binding HxlR family transcriptional regulator
MLFQRLAVRPHGFGELRRAMPGVAPKVLREQLRQMQADDLVSRSAPGPAYEGVRYGLTAYGPLGSNVGAKCVSHFQSRKWTLGPPSDGTRRNESSGST